MTLFRLNPVLLLVALTRVVFAVGLYPRWTDDFVKRDSESLSGVPTGWKLLSEAHPDHVVKLRFGLKQSSFDGLIERLYQISDPNHSQYGLHLSKEEADAFVSPHSSTLDIFNEWLSAHHIDPSKISFSPAQDWATLTLPVLQASDMLNSNFQVFQHQLTGRKVVRSLEYSLPKLLDEFVDTVQPTTYFGLSETSIASFQRRKRSVLSPQQSTDYSLNTHTFAASEIDPSCANGTNLITPACLRTLYKMNTYVPQAVNQNKLGVVNYFGECQNRDDLQAFFASYRPDAVNSSFEVEIVNNGTFGTVCEGEGPLDIEYSTSLSYPTPNIAYAVGGVPPFTPDDIDPFNGNEPYLDWVMYVLNQTDPPQTFSTSYADDEQTVPKDYATRVCNAFAQLGARGVSLIFGSGDAGVGGGSCLSNDGTNTTRFQPLFPASCPYVTTVGGTNRFPEVAASASGSDALYGGTGGGFSNYFPRPSYQDAAVAQYLDAQGDTYKGLYNASGRAYPDLAAQSNIFVTIEGGEEFEDSGTSASTPVVAAVVSLLNDYLISEGKSPLGFLNPWLYAKGYQGLSDIVNGSNPGCGTDGFAARVGWDPTTGFGTPDFERLRQLL